jgi:DNA-binding CsgD family transcriptional regulator
LTSFGKWEAQVEPKDLPVGVGHGSVAGISSAAIQVVLDAAAVLQMRRSEAAAAAERGELTTGEVVAVGTAGAHEWLHTQGAIWRENLSVRPGASTTQLRASLPVNRVFLAGGAQMVSVFDYQGLDAEGRILLANEPVGDYLFGRAPVQMKIVDRRFVILEGPSVNGSMSLMTVHSSSCMEAAWRYWDAVVASAIPVADAGISDLGLLTKRQRQVVALLASDLGDDAIAASLGVSVRTVRAEVAAVLAVLGVKSRFAAATRLARLEGTT